MFRLVVLFFLIQYVYGGCLVNPDSNGHVSAADLEGRTYIWSNAFYRCTALKSVEIPASVTTINRYAFEQTTNLENITFLGNITTIKGHSYYYEYGAFYRSGENAAAMSITFMGNVGTIEQNAFYRSGYNANTMSITFMGNVGTIEQYAFKYSGTNTDTMSITFMGDVDTIETYVFLYSGENANFMSVDFHGDVGTISPYDYPFSGSGVTSYTGSVTNPSSVFYGSQYTKCRLDETPPGMNLTSGHGTYDGTSTDSFAGCIHLKSVTIGSGVVEIGQNAFRHTALVSVDFSSASELKTIKQYAFYYTDLASIEIPASVTTIERSAFYNTALVSVDLSSASELKTIKQSTFYNTDLASIEIPASVTTIEKYAFYNNKNLNNITFLGDITTIEGGSSTEGAFGYSGYDANTMSITFMGTVGTIGDYAFYRSGYNTDTLSITFMKSVGTIGSRAFTSSGYNADTLSITYTETVGTFEDYAFGYSGYNTDAMSMTFMGDVGTIGDNAFYKSGYNADAMSLDFQKDVSTIGEKAFYNSGVRSVTYGGNLPDIDTSAFDNTQYKICRLHETPPGMNITTGHVVYSNISQSFEDCKLLTSVTIADDVEEIGENAFKYSSFQTVDFSLATSLKTIGKNAFYSSSLTSVTIPNNVETINDGAFGWNHLTSLIIPESVVAIGSTDTYAKGAFTYNSITELAILGAPTFEEYKSTSSYRTFVMRHGSHYELQLQKFCGNYSALPGFIQNQLDMTNAVHDCTFWCETGDMQISTNYACTQPWSTACDAGSYIAPKPAGMQVSMSDTCTPCPAGTFQPNSTSTATECTPCPADTFQSNHGSNSCNAWSTTCPQGHRMVAGTAVSDTCAPCPAGTFQPNSDSTATQCTPWQTCSTEEIRLDGTSTTDVACGGVHSIRTVDGWSSDKSDIKASWRSKGYCDTNVADGSVHNAANCPVGSVIIDAMRCSDKKEHLLAAWNIKANCPS